MKQKKFYYCTYGATLLLFLIFVVVSNNNYNELLKVCEEESNIIKEQELFYENALKDLEKKYEDLQVDYVVLKEKNTTLKEKNTLLKHKLKRVKLPEYKYTKDEIYLLAQCVEAEAGYYDNHALSQKYVTQVILNRLHSSKFPNTIEEVIYESHNGIPQFSVAYNGMIDREVEAETLMNVYSVLIHGTDLPKYVCYFYSDFVKENWVNMLPIYKTVEGTVFAYKSKEDY